MDDDEQRSGRERPANDNRAPAGQDTEGDAAALERLDAVVLSIARLIGRRMAREDYEKAMDAANDNTPPEAGDDDG
jgi:hypothetical protein